jgi:hypothetical protein
MTGTPSDIIPVMIVPVVALAFWLIMSYPQPSPGTAGTPE